MAQFNNKSHIFKRSLSSVKREREKKDEFQGRKIRIFLEFVTDDGNEIIRSRIYLSLFTKCQIEFRNRINRLKLHLQKNQICQKSPN